MCIVNIRRFYVGNKKKVSIIIWSLTVRCKICDHLKFTNPDLSIWFIHVAFSSIKKRVKYRGNSSTWKIALHLKASQLCTELSKTSIVEKYRGCDVGFPGGRFLFERYFPQHLSIEVYRPSKTRKPTVISITLNGFIAAYISLSKFSPVVIRAQRIQSRCLPRRANLTVASKADRGRMCVPKVRREGLKLH